jgi:hypothetical protein
MNTPIRNHDRTPSQTPSCTYMAVEPVSGDPANTLGAVTVDLLDTYRARLDVWRMSYLNRAKRWNVLYYVLLCISICATTTASVIVAAEVAPKWAVVTLTLLASGASSLLAALHPIPEQERARAQAGVAIRLRGKISVLLTGYARMDNVERQLAVESIVNEYSNFVDGGTSLTGDRSTAGDHLGRRT